MYLSLSIYVYIYIYTYACVYLYMYIYTYSHTSTIITTTIINVFYIISIVTMLVSWLISESRGGCGEPVAVAEDCNGAHRSLSAQCYYY